ncbi:hypothetical protein M8C21_023712 [Ambrosia artemisiifolia]|uniref:tRNA-splicing endonuclease subunit Sen54 N-terminal domain-containing protein n=1 Tax=Ambrosia artemisiifolia TaxID=4212 RepID=A0AAD5D9Y9_AMBAR|nr:hypothetical protein M8C21_023712 [Ambrosia artemisiifolia]
MEIEDWAAPSGGSSDTEVTSLDSDNEDHCNAYGDISKLQFSSKARWKEDLGMAEIVSNKGRMWTTTGIVRAGKLYSFLEETLFLAEIGALQLLDDEEKCIPLEDIYKKVGKGVGGSSWESFEINGAKPVFDVYPPNSKFRKSSPCKPMFILCINTGNPPTRKQIEDLEEQCEGVPLKFCYVDHGRVSFFSFNKIELPVLP